MSSLATIIKPAPVLNTPDFNNVFGGKDGSSLLTDSQGLIRAVEMIALENTPLELIKPVSPTIFEVKIPSYSSDPLYIDSRFFSPTEQHRERKPVLKNTDSLLSFLYAQLGLSYVWGGNYNRGIPEMLEYYPPASSISDAMKIQWILQGFDCSGLLYQATNGFTPRNTSSLIRFGEGIPIEHLTPKEIEKSVQPLDILVWKGHVIIVVDQGKTIQSTLGKGVVIETIQETVAHLMSTKKGMNAPSAEPYFLLRRWC